MTASDMAREKNRKKRGTASEQEPPADDACAEADAVPAIELSPEAAELVAQLERERDEAIESWKRAVADFRNYQRRALENETRARQGGVSHVVKSLITVLDHVDLALGQDPAKVSAEQLFGGVKLVREELLTALQAHGVERVEPEVGEEFDPNRHEAMLNQAAEGVGPNAIAAVLQPGYLLGEMVLRPAKVAVTPGA